MLTITQIVAIHSKVKSGADFPKYIQELIALGVRSYDTFVVDGHTTYKGSNDYEIESEAKYPVLSVSESGNAELFKMHLKNHQQGGSDYLTFCNESAQSGVEKWTVDMTRMTCTYYDKKGNDLLMEVIPEV